MRDRIQTSGCSEGVFNSFSQMPSLFLIPYSLFLIPSKKLQPPTNPPTNTQGQTIKAPAGRHNVPSEAKIVWRLLSQTGTWYELRL